MHVLLGRHPLLNQFSTIVDSSRPQGFEGESEEQFRREFREILSRGLNNFVFRDRKTVFQLIQAKAKK